MTAEHQEELKNEIQRLLKLLKMKTAVYNIETREGTDGKAYIMELSPRGGRYDYQYGKVFCGYACR